MKFWDIVKSANSNLLRNKSRTFLTVLAIFIGAFTIIMTTGINTGVNNYIDKQVNAAGMENYIDIMAGADESMINMGPFGGSEVQEYNSDKSVTAQFLSENDIKKISKIDGIKQARGSNQISAEYITSNSADKKFQINVSALPSSSYNLDLAAGKIVDNDSDEYQINLQDSYLKPLGFDNAEDAIGKKVQIAVMEQATMASSKKIDIVEAKIAGVQNSSVISLGRNFINNSLSDALYDYQMSGLPEEYKNRYYFAYAEMKWEKPTDEQVAQIKDKLTKLNATGVTIDDQAGMIKTFFSAITTVLTIFGIIALIAASIGIINTLFMAVQERTREIGLMKAMGLGRAKIFLMFSVEAIALGFWGGMIGVGIAFITKEITNNVAVATFLKDLPGFTLVEFNPITLVVIVIILMLIAFFAGTLPARRAAGKDPIEALRYE